ncbi:hypothetical protein FM115_04030 [Marinilactibacillus psychrotolerans 42ea]|uniref:ABC-three component systems C-terminal domain-containing protein n=1 Tax=Marinilactibacillus psychrotolerans 42ea TaxID=1255609 RepID=A0A1R4J5W6_9LACT|nr:ABC-three component system protein [Marinilactibacillus psychrotolerans]SJN27422.1 hypothetical protein FM115_04030 [Marinilactibacillus psychrotolerans 42ea]
MDNRNATASWSGYLHQGKVGMFLSLQKINDCLLNDKAFNRITMEYESAEDIDLKLGNLVISRHQVKAYKNAKYPNDYIDVLSKQKYEIENGKRKLIQKGFQIMKYNEQSGEYELEVDEESRFLHVINEVKGFNMDKVEFENTYKLSKYVPNDNNIKLYKYPDGKDFCPLRKDDNDNLKEFCIKEIEKILHLQDHIYKNDRSHCEYIYYELLNLLDTEIRINHIEGKYPKILFEDIINIVTSIEKKKNQALNIIRRSFVECWDKFVYDLEINNITVSDEHFRKTESVIKDLNYLDDAQFIEFLMKINIHRVIVPDKITPEDVPKICSVDAFNEIFYSILIQVDSLEFDKNIVGYDFGEGYLLTLINQKPARIGSLLNDLISKKYSVEKIYNEKYLINGHIDNHFIGEKIDEVAATNSVNWNREVSLDNIFYLSKMHLIKVESAIEKLNEES